MAPIRSINPEREAYKKALAGIPENTPVVMVNLLKFRDRADTDDGAAMSGREVYAKYLDATVPLIAKLGAKPIWFGNVKGCITAPPDEEWDQVILVRYPSIAAFKTMLKLPEYQACHPLRTAALLDSRLICTVEEPA